MKTDLAKILSVAGQRGLYLYLAQARNGVIAENIADKKRTLFDAKSRVTSLEDIAIYTSEGELKLSEVFLALQKTLSGAAVPDSKADNERVKALFDKAVPNYDADRFYVSHMRKIIDWYSQLEKYASLEFVTAQEREQQQD